MQNFYVLYSNSESENAQDSLLTQIQNTFTQANRLGSWTQMTDDTNPFFWAKRLGRRIPDTTADPAVVLVIGSTTLLTEVVNGLIAAKRTYQLPIAHLQFPTTIEPEATNQPNPLITQSQSLLQVKQSHTQYLAHVVGALPKKADRYFLNRLTVGISLDLFESKLPAKGNLLNQFFSWWRWLEQFNLQTSFPTYLGLKNRYLSHRKTLTFTLTNHPDSGRITALIVDKMNFIGMFLAFWQLQRQKEPAQVHGFEETEVSAMTTVHIADIQTATADGKRLGTGTFAFTVDSYAYPFWS